MIFNLIKSAKQLLFNKTGTNLESDNVQGAIEELDTELGTLNTGLSTVKNKLNLIQGIISFTGDKSGIVKAFNGKANGYYLLIGTADYGYAFGYGYKNSNSLVGSYTTSINYNGSPIRKEYAFAGSLTNVTIESTQIL